MGSVRSRALRKLQDAARRRGLVAAPEPNVEVATVEAAPVSRTTPSRRPTPATRQHGAPVVDRADVEAVIRRQIEEKANAGASRPLSARSAPVTDGTPDWSVFRTPLAPEARPARAPAPADATATDPDRRDFLRPQTTPRSTEGELREERLRLRTQANQFEGELRDRAEGSAREVDSELAKIEAGFSGQAINAGTNLMRGVSRTVPTLMDAGAAAIELGGLPALSPFQRVMLARRGREMAEATSGTIDQLLPTDERLDRTLASQVGQGAGSTVPFLVASYFTGGSYTGATGLGVALGAGQGYREGSEARDRGEATSADVALGTILYGATGAIEGVPIGRAFERADVATGGGVTRYLKSLVAESGEEAAQEWVSAQLQDGAARASFDEDRPFDAHLMDAVVGGLVGAGSATVVEAGAAARRSGDVSAETLSASAPSPLRRQAVEKLARELGRTENPFGSPDLGVVRTQPEPTRTENDIERSRELAERTQIAAQAADTGAIERAEAVTTRGAAEGDADAGVRRSELVRERARRQLDAIGGAELDGPVSDYLDPASTDPGEYAAAVAEKSGDPEEVAATYRMVTDAEARNTEGTVEGTIADWLQNDAISTPAVWPELYMIEPARAYPGRHGAILLPWRASGAALSSIVESS